MLVYFLSTATLGFEMGEEQNSEITRLVSRVLRDTGLLARNSADSMTKLEEKVAEGIGVVVDDFIDNSLQAAALHALQNNSGVMEKKIILHYFYTNYGAGLSGGCEL